MNKAEVTQAHQLPFLTFPSRTLQAQGINFMMLC